MRKRANTRRNLRCYRFKVGNPIRSRRNPIVERDQLLKRAKSAEDSWDIPEAISNYQLAATISKEIGEFEKSRQLTEKVSELKRHVQLVRKKSLVTKKIRLEETKDLDLERDANEALEIAGIAEDEHRWADAIESYGIAIKKYYEMGDLDKVKAFQEKVALLKQALNTEE